MSEQHKPGALKQSNKAHNTGKHKSKGAAAKISKGKVDVKVLTKKKQRLLNKQAKNNQREQLRKQKRLQVLEEKRSRGVKGSPPFLVSVLPTNTDQLEVKDYLHSLLETCQDEEFLSIAIKDRSTLVNCHRFKQRFELIFPTTVIGHLDGNKASDCLLIVVSIDDLSHTDQSELANDDEVKRDWLLNERATRNLDNVYNQGLSNVVICCKGLTAYPVKKQSDAKKFLAGLFEKKFPEARVHALDSTQDFLLLLRQVASHKAKKVMYRQIRSHLFASEASFVPHSENSETGQLLLSGYLRGPFVTANQLFHIPSHGNHQVTLITASPEPPLFLQDKKRNALEQETVVLSKPQEAARESLECYVVGGEGEGDDDDDEEEEEEDADMVTDGQSTKEVSKKVVPKGFSKYQAAWLNDDDEDDDDDEEEEEEEEDAKMADGDAQSLQKQEEAEEEEEEDDEAEEEGDEGEMETTGQDPMEEEEEEYDEDAEANNLQRYKEARLNEMFPDEVDTPGDMSARVRFQKYRGMKSFRTSPWDPTTDLPEEYSKIVRFNRFDDVRRKLIKTIIKKNKQVDEEEEDEDDEAKKVRAGTYVTLHLADVNHSITDLLNSHEPLISHALLPFEQNISVVHFLIRRCANDDLPIKSKQPMIFHVGCHRFKARPIYSQHSPGDRHKFERFFLPSSIMVASVYAPLIFPPANVLMFRPDSTSEGEKLVATGSVLSVNPDRMLIKRCVLSGHPFKIHTNSAVIRYMFFTADDVRWFAPIELRTKYGRKGRIVEPVGTHGHMKCKFNKHLTSQDTVLLHLYKRVFPKWNDFSALKT